MRIRTIKKQLLLSVLVTTMIAGINPAQAYMSPEATSLYQQACTYEYKQDFKSAAAALEKAIVLSGNEPQLYTKLAGAYTELGEYDKALAAYAKVTELRPTDAFIYVSMGSIYEHKGDYKSALDSYNKAMILFPEYKYNYLNIANAQYQLKDYKSATETYNKFLETYSQHKEARESLAASYLLTGDAQKAVMEYDKLYAADPNNFNDLDKYGYALFCTKDYQKSSDILSRYIEKRPEDLNSRSILALAYQELDENDLAYAQYQEMFKQKPDLHAVRLDYANLLADMGKNAEAIQQYDLYIKNFPDNAIAYKNLGIVYKRLNNIDKAIANYELAIAKHCRDFDLKADLAQCYHLKKDYTNAIKYYDEILLVQKDNFDVKLNKALALHAMQKYPAAIALYDDLLQAKPDNKQVKKNLIMALISQGQVCYDAKDYTTAATYLEQAVAKGSEEGFGYYLLAKTYRQCSMPDKASEMYEKAIAMEPANAKYSNEYAEFIAAQFNNGQLPADNEDAQLAATGGELPAVSVNENFVKENVSELDSERHKDLIDLGDENLKNKKYDECIVNYQEALKIRPSDEQTLFKLGYVYKLKNDNANAINFYKKAIFVNPDYTDGWFNLGLIYADENNLSGAIDAFNRVVTLDKNYGYAYYALALAYENEKDYINAIQNYKLFLEHSDDDITKKAVKEKLKTLEK